MQTLSYGYSLPQTGDKGTALWTALQNDISQLNNHVHDGVTSALIPVSNFKLTTQTLSSANWVTYTNAPTGFYRQSVTMPAGFSYDTCSMVFRLSTGQYMFPTIEKVDNATYYIYTNDNTISVIAGYGI